MDAKLKQHAMYNTTTHVLRVNPPKYWLCCTVRHHSLSNTKRSSPLMTRQGQSESTSKTHRHTEVKHVQCTEHPKQTQRV